MRLQEVAIVTGGVHGMGEAEARLFAAEGAKVIVADILEGDAEIVAADIQAGGEDATAAQIDVTSEAEWIGLIAKAVATYGRLDILVNNAGISGSAVGNPDGLEGWHRIIAVNQTSVFVGTKLAAEQMAKTGGGSIVNICSIMGFCRWRQRPTLPIAPQKERCESTRNRWRCAMAPGASVSTQYIPAICYRC
jgi:NAD(P)-dependent dehydrogenase (short-subunit alcohol dehydrogenase family)